MSESTRNTPDQYSLFLLFKEYPKDSMILRNSFIPILNFLNSLNVTIKDLVDFSDLLKSSTMKNKMHPNPDSNKLLNKKDFCLIFQILFKITNDKNYISERCLNRMNYSQRNILFLYFSLKYPNEMHEIASKYFTDFEFQYKICNKEELAIQWHKYVYDLQNKYCQILPLKLNETSFKNDINHQKNIINISIPINHIENQNKYHFGNNHGTFTVFGSHKVIYNHEIFSHYPVNRIFVSC